MSSVWCKVVTLGGINIGHVVKISPVPIDINDLCEMVKAKMEFTLNYCDATQLTVFPAGTTNFGVNTKGYKRSCKDFPKVDDEDCALIVLAPQKESGTCMVVLP